MCERPLLEAAKFSKSKQYLLRFSSQQNHIQIFPREQAVLIELFMYEPINIPNDYIYYYYSMEAGAVLTNEAIDFILTCEKAQTIIFDDSGDLASRLLYRVDEWENM